MKLAWSIALAAALAQAGPAAAGACTSVRDCALGQPVLAGAIVIGLASLLGLVALLALDGAFGPAAADDFTAADGEAVAPAAQGTLRLRTRREVDVSPELPDLAAEPEYGSDRLFLRPPVPKPEDPLAGKSLFKADDELEPEDRFAATAKDRDAFDGKLDGLAKSYKPDNADYAKVSTTLDDDGKPTEGSITYFNRRFDNTLPIFTVSVDCAGDPVGAGPTAAGCAFQALQAFLPDDEFTTVTVSYAQDRQGETYIDRARVHDQNDVLRADLQFNEDGQAWLGERYDAKGKRTGVLDNPDMAPGAAPAAPSAPASAAPSVPARQHSPITH